MMCTRPFAPTDARDILTLYTHYVLHTHATFEIEPPTPEAFTERLCGIAGSHPFFVSHEDGALTGYAYAARHRERAAYRFDVDVSVYVRDGARGRGVGTALYVRLFDALNDTEFVNAYAAIALPNEASVALHHRFGFTDIGVHHHTGLKLGRWHDVLWLEKSLKPV